MTRRWRSDTPQEPWKAWIRDQPGLDSGKHHIVAIDSDLWVHRYATRLKGVTLRDVQYMMLVEFKAHGSDLEDSQHDTLHIVNQVLRTEKWKTDRVNGRYAPGHRQNTATVRVWSSWLRREIQIISYGAHLCRFDGPCPATSTEITWDRQRITADELVELLRFDRHPDSRRPMEHRRHKRIDDHPALPFDLEVA